MTTRTPHRIELADYHPDYSANWVDIKAKMSYAMQLEYEGAGVGMKDEGGLDPRQMNRAQRRHMQKTGEGAGEQKLTYSHAEREIKFLEMCIVAWNLTDDDNRPIPANRDGFFHEDLDGDVMIFVADAMDAYYKSLERTPEERMDLAEPSTEPSSLERRAASRSA